MRGTTYKELRKMLTCDYTAALKNHKEISPQEPSLCRGDGVGSGDVGRRVVEARTSTDECRA